MAQEVINFADRFGLPKDRLKLESGIINFDIVKVEMKESKKMYDVTKVTDAGNKEVKKMKIPIAYIDAHIYDDNGKPSQDVSKFFSSSMPIVEACKEILVAYGTKDGALKSAVHINEVKEEHSKEGGNPYLFFT